MVNMFWQIIEVYGAVYFLQFSDNIWDKRRRKHGIDLFSHPTRSSVHAFAHNSSCESLAVLRESQLIQIFSQEIHSINQER